MNLEEFLKNRGAYEAFIQNLYDSKCNGVMYREEYDSLQDCMDDVPISCAFFWRNAPEEHDYWSRLNDEFSKLD